jgi:hypothetical protein
MFQKMSKKLISLQKHMKEKNHFSFQKSFSTNDDIRATEQAAARTDWATSQGKTYY